MYRYIVELAHRHTGEIIKAELDRTPDVNLDAIIMKRINSYGNASWPARFFQAAYRILSINRVGGTTSKTWMFTGMDTEGGWKKARSIKKMLLDSETSKPLGLLPAKTDTSKNTSYVYGHKVWCKEIADTLEGRHHSNNSGYVIFRGSLIDKKLKETYNIKRVVT